MHLAASVLARQSQGASMVSAPRAEKPYFQHVELISTQGRQILVVLVMLGGEVSQQLLTLAEPVSQERLSQTAALLNTVMAGRSVEDIAALPARTDALEQDILMLILAELRRSASNLFGEIYTDGLSNVLSEPEFAEFGYRSPRPEAARRAFHASGIAGSHHAEQHGRRPSGADRGRGRLGRTTPVFHGPREVRRAWICNGRIGRPGTHAHVLCKNHTNGPLCRWTLERSRKRSNWRRAGSVMKYRLSRAES